ncbi:hypothetical protein GUITHDRAFT_109662 [Guillardia theta CCMP2712]|uniref:Tr-type G domain-containing protein n=2 Tax=Guillardia theta TaxID=55529 RepID=L1J878_GUITC|nr:hypothetical protein GUITHDRAFT_109662 [Guillardia theta CCMP2712]EKX44547.1 hypothetical protein GUITHDRAFT_109662 [Guillardia theta CCMP2712]|eukprot:XP_005831527.1 hypothetical protein GUITHDRAFT_109662 [Guillardia theta CCMP2712]
MTATAPEVETNYDEVTVDNIRNIAIIAHVDHGKTTLVDKLLEAAKENIDNEDGGDRAMDSMDLERERGITIMSKVTSMAWNGVKLNIVDTPGHADFGGEVERVMSMVDGVCLLVDATEGPMAQTKFVLMKALARGIKPLVVINKVDRDTSRVDEVEGEVFDLMCNLGATDEQLDYTTVYASGRNGWATLSHPDGPRENMNDLLDTIVKTVPKPSVLDRPSFSMVVTMIEGDSFLGRICTGRVSSGVVKVGDTVQSLSADGQKVDTGRITKILARKGTGKVQLNSAKAGDIVQVAGLQKATVAHTICSPDVEEPLPSVAIDPPTLAMTFCPNDSPLAGKDKLSTKLTSQMIGERLRAEAENNIAIRVAPSEERSEAYDVMGRGELQLGILVENMRREGFELGVCPPQVLYKTGPKGEKLEPIEDVVVEVDDEFSGAVINKLSERKAVMTDMRPAAESGRTRITLECPTRGLLGYRSIFFTDTRGTGIMTRAFKAYEPYKGDLENIRKGVLVSMKTGVATSYSLGKLQPRGEMFINPGVEVYPGMIIGEHSRDNDLEVNPIEAKQLTNMRAAGADEKIQLTPPRDFTLEEMIPYLQPDEMAEVTPSTIRMRKQILDPNLRKRKK